MRLACDTGGTFTDLVVEGPAGELRMFKASTTPDDPVAGVLDAISLAAEAQGLPLDAFLAGVETLIHGTTHAINAVITGRTARTAFLTTSGHRDMLVLREGGRHEPFDFTVEYPEPYIPRALSFEVDERIGADGTIVRPLDEESVRAAAAAMRAAGIEAIAVCLLWSVVNSAHEERVGEILAEELPEAAVTLSHRLNPTIREFRRASATAIDASLKPLMGRYLGSLSERLVKAGFGGTLLVLTSQGSMVPAHDVAAAPIRAINSGPSLAPVAGRHFGRAVSAEADIIVADTGGTTYDVSLVRGGTIPLTRDAWIGAPYRGHLTGFPSVDVQSVGAGGGSIAHVDAGGLLKVGPRSAGSQPGPACYGRGGTDPTLTDACLILGYLDPAYFLGGQMPLDYAAAEAAIERHVARPLGLSNEAAAAAIVALGTENMVQAIVDITVTQGIDPRRSVLIGGGGAAGLNSVFIARRLGIPTLIIPELGATLSAGGALMSEMAADFRAIRFMTTADFDIAGANTCLSDLARQAAAFLAEASEGAVEHRTTFAIEARYAQQVWEIDVTLPFDRIGGADDVDRLEEAFHMAHEAIFGFRDPASAVEIIGWSARASYRTGPTEIGRVRSVRAVSGERTSRHASFPGHGAVPTAILPFEAMAVEARHAGPAVVETPFSSIVIDPDCHFYRQDNGSLVIALDYPEEKP